MHWLFDDLRSAEEIPEYQSWEDAARYPAQQVIEAVRRKLIRPDEAQEAIHACCAIFFAAMVEAGAECRAWGAVKPGAEDLLLHGSFNAARIKHTKNAMRIDAEKTAVRKRQQRHRQHISNTIEKTGG